MESGVPTKSSANQTHEQRTPAAAITASVSITAAGKPRQFGIALDHNVGGGSAGAVEAGCNGSNVVG